MKSVSVPSTNSSAVCVTLVCWVYSWLCWGKSFFSFFFLSLKVCILSATDSKVCFFLPFPFGHWFPFTCDYMKVKTRLHLQMWWKILLLFNLDLLAASLPRDRHPSLCPTPLILLIFTTFSPIVPPLRTLPCPSACWDEGDGKEVCLNTLCMIFFFSQLSQNRPEKSDSSVCVCSTELWP